MSKAIIFRYFGGQKFRRRFFLQGAQILMPRITDILSASAFAQEMLGQILSIRKQVKKDGSSNVPAEFFGLTIQVRPSIRHCPTGHDMGY